ncbi:peritrophin-44-like protein [Penaeus vannamei]|uniref:Peritrophin-44-like protein n=1 Tax=Penaeus vannamei TaxID=6689 RepID=A0A3R7LX56_PENVA|nr:peritrophin-44-like protein [Penaeus vannamei]
MLNPVQKAIVLLGVCVAVAVCVDKCSPDCTGKPAGFMVPDPMDCKQFYYCLNGEFPMDHPFPCGPGMIFDVILNKCQVGTDCTAQCPTAVPNCHFTCDATYDLVRDPSSCSQYFQCLPHGLEGPFACGSGTPYFNGENCVDDEGACCSDQCTAYCEAAMTQIADPKNCTNYYICLAPGLASEENHFPPSATLTSSPSVTSTTMETSTTVCIDSLVCTVPGAFSKCNTCDKEFFYCDTIGQEAGVYTCTGDLVFNPDPAYPFCVLPTNCPYHPPYED